MPDVGGFIHAFVPGERPLTILALHGTGGDESSMLPFASAVAPGAAILAPKGRVSENGMARFFRRSAPGVFDLEDLQAQAAALAQFVDDARSTYRLEGPIVGLGFSNGANMAAALLLTHPDLLAGAALLRAMVPLDVSPLPDLHGVGVWMGSGRRDPMVPVDESRRLAEMLEYAGAEVTHHWEPGGHRLGHAEDRLIKAWFDKR